MRESESAARTEAAHRCLIDFLSNTYGDDLFKHNDITYPVVVFPSSPEGQADVDSALWPDYPRTFIDPATFTFYDSDHLDELRTSRPGIADNITYVLHHLGANPLRIEAKLGRYFDMLATCDALDHELLDYARGRRSDLPRRER